MEVTGTPAMAVCGTVELDGLAKSREIPICNFDRREKSNLFKALAFQDFSLRSK
jgi:hypothetical protein